MILFSAIVPHPPVIIPEIGQEKANQVKKTIHAMEKLSEQLNEVDPETIVFFTPHALTYADRFNIVVTEKLQSVIDAQGEQIINWKGKNNLALAEKIAQQCEEEEMDFNLQESESEVYTLDQGIAVPLYYFAAHLSTVKVVSISYSYSSLQEQFDFGQIFGEICEKTPERIAIIASGDLSHRHFEKPQIAQQFDDQVINRIKNNQLSELNNINEQLVEQSGECGYRSNLMLSGALSEKILAPEIYSYETPFGIGYLVANLNVINENR
jgi:aromatic ring-opening dioxygenase LigB subunit